MITRFLIGMIVFIVCNQYFRIVYPGFAPNAIILFASGLIACLPDLLVEVFVDGAEDKTVYRQGKNYSHSLNLTAVCFIPLLIICFVILGFDKGLAATIIGVLCYNSHLLLEFLGLPDVYGRSYGVKARFPYSDEIYLFKNFKVKVYVDEQVEKYPRQQNWLKLVYGLKGGKQNWYFWWGITEYVSLAIILLIFLTI
jgi:hypothetical protein